MRLIAVVSLFFISSIAVSAQKLPQFDGATARCQSLFQEYFPFEEDMLVETPDGFQNLISGFWSDGTVAVLNARTIANPSGRFLPEQLKYKVSPFGGFQHHQLVETPDGFQNFISGFWSDRTIAVLNAQTRSNPRGRFLPEQLKAIKK